MRKPLLLSLLCLLVITLSILPGCGKKSTDPVSGDTTSANFQAMSGLIQDGVLPNNGSMIDLSLNLIDSIPGVTAGKQVFKPRVAGGEVIQIVHYDTSNYWHIFSISAVYSQENTGDTDSIIYAGYDSLRFGRGDSFVWIPDSTITALDIRAHLGIKIKSQGDSIFLKSHAVVNLLGTFRGAFTVSGASSDTLGADISNDSGSCSLDLSLNQTFTNLAWDSGYSPAEECPMSGGIAMTSNLDMSCVGNNVNPESFNVTGTWNMNFLFHDGLVTATYRHEGVQWVVTEDCSGATSAKEGWSGLMKRVAEIKE